jgi:predicted DNA-binding protein with PD1-like motif
MESKRSLSVETRASQHVVGRIYRGTGLRDALRELADEHRLRTAWVTAMGAFEWIELTEYSQIHRRYETAHRFERCELLSMQGNLSERDGEPFWHLHATLSLREGDRDVTYGGHVVDGSVFALEFRIDRFDELALKRVNDEATGLQLWVAADAAAGEDHTPSAAGRAAAGVTWAMAAELSVRDRLVDHEEEKPERGDWIEHPKFGLCKIESLSGEGVCIIKLPDARRKKIKIDAMQVHAPRTEGAGRVFPVRPKPKG